MLSTLCLSLFLCAFASKVRKSYTPIQTRHDIFEELHSAPPFFNLLRTKRKVRSPLFIILTIDTLFHEQRIFSLLLILAVLKPHNHVPSFTPLPTPLDGILIHLLHVRLETALIHVFGALICMHRNLPHGYQALKSAICIRHFGKPGVT